MDTAEPRCISFGGMAVDQHVVAEALRVLQPAAIEAAVLAAERKRTTQDDLLRAIELELKAARYEAARAEKRYEAVDSDNRLVAEELEARWNTALNRVHELEQRLERERLQAAPATVADRKSMIDLARDLEHVWNSPNVEQRTRKRLLRSLLNEIVIDLDDDNHLILILHWSGGVHTDIQVTRRRRGQNGAHTDKDLVDVVRSLARIATDEFIAGALNKAGRTTGRGNRWNEQRVKSLRSHHQIERYCSQTKARAGWMSLKDAALHLQISASALRRLAERNEIPSEHPLPNGPWIFKRDHLDDAKTRSLVDGIRRGRGAASARSQLELGISTK